MTVRRNLQLLLLVGLVCGFIQSSVTVGYAQTPSAPDLVVESISVGTLTADGNYPVVATVKNQGNAPMSAGPFLVFVQFWFSTDSVLNTGSDTMLSGPSPLPPFTTLAPGQTINSPPMHVALPGPGYLIAEVDSGKQVLESNETNNTFSQLFTPAVPDLIPTSVTAPVAVDVGTSLQPADISWTVRNQGNGPAGSPGWIDEFHLSEDPVYGGSNDFHLGSKRVPDSVVPLAPGASYTTGPNAAFAVPLKPAGTYYVVFRTNVSLGNPNASIGEGPGGFDNNTYTGTVPIQFRVPDLQVTTFTVSPGAVEPGGNLSFSYTVTNEGDAPAFRNIGGGTDPSLGWSDRLQLSRDATYEDASSAETVFLNLIQGTPVPRRLEPGASYTVTGSVMVPAGAGTGDWYVLVKTDHLDNAGAWRHVYEGNGEGNNVLAANSGTALRVDNKAPELTAGGPYTVAEGETVDVSGSGTDPEDDAMTYAWDLDDDGLFETPGQTATFSAEAIDGAATRTAVFRACDAYDACATSDAAIEVGNVDPNARFDAPADVNEGDSITIRLVDPADPSQADVEAGFHYAFACQNGDLSDATYETTGAENDKVCTAYDDGDSATTVKGRIIDEDNGFTEYSAPLTVHNVAPTATLQAPQSVDEGTAFTVTLANSADPSEADVAAGFTYAFDCGDGYGEFGTSNSATCPTGDNGERTVRAMIRDKDDGQTEYTATVAVANVAPAATFSAPATVEAGQAIALSLTGATDPSSVDASAGFAYAFDCGDGAGFGSFGAGATATCPTSAAGTRTVTGRIRDKDGGERTYTASVTINPVAVNVYAATVRPPVNADGSSIFKASRGSVPVKFSLTANGAPTCELPPATIAVTRISGSVAGAVNESVYTTPADGGNAFRIADCQYIYNVSAPGLGPGVYQMDIVIDGTVVGSARFELK